MHALAGHDLTSPFRIAPAENEPRLSELHPGARGVVVRVDGADGSSLDALELERRLLEFGFVEGAVIQVLHEGLFGMDPMAVRLDDMRVALRRREARNVHVRLLEDAPDQDAARP